MADDGRIKIVITSRMDDEIQRHLRVLKNTVVFLLPEHQEQAVRDNKDFSEYVDDITAKYKSIIHDTNLFNRKLIAQLESLTKDLHAANRTIDTMEQDMLEDRIHHPKGFINRRYFIF